MEKLKLQEENVSSLSFQKIKQTKYYFLQNIMIIVLLPRIFTDMYPIERMYYTFCILLCKISFLITPQPLKFLKQLPVRISARWWRRRLVQFQFLE